MFVTVHVHREVAQDLTGARREDPRTTSLEAVLSGLGLKAEPLHPGTSEPELAAQFYVAVPNERVGQDLCERLQESGAVEAAYVKPPESPPSSS